MKKTMLCDDLAELCNYSNRIKEFRRILKFHNIQYSNSRPLSKKDCERVHLAITGREIVWYEVKQDARDVDTGGPLSYIEPTDAIIKNVETFASQYDLSPCASDKILALSLEGGFLKGRSDEVCCISLSQAINVFVGERGSGKSTMLNLFGMWTLNTAQVALSLVESIVTEIDSRDREISEANRSAHNTLKQYSINIYCLFTSVRQKLHAIYVDRTQRIMCIFQRQNDHWANYKTINIPVPRIQVLMQGEIYRISDPDNRHYISTLLDALNPSLAKDRQSLAHQCRQLSSIDTSSIGESKEFVDDECSHQFSQERYNEINRITALIEKNYKDSQVVEEINKLLANSFNCGYEAQEFYNIADQPLWNYCASAHGLWLVYILPVESYLRKWQVHMNNLHRGVASKQVVAEIRKKLEEEPSSRGYLDTTSVGAEYDSKKLLQPTCRYIVELLRQRLNVVRKLVEASCKDAYRWSEELEALLIAYSNFAHSRARLFSSHSSFCQDLTRSVNGKEGELVDISVRMPDYCWSAKAVDTGAEYIKQLWQSWADARLMVGMSQGIESLLEYRRLVDIAVNDCNRVKEESETKKHLSLVYYDVQINCKQGKLMRPFEHLSFGQKSGVVLRMVLASSSAPVIVIDQPEDNLDASAISRILLPAFNSLSGDRQIILATHSSQLALGLDSPQIVVMQSRGESGIVYRVGRKEETDVVRAMLDIMEGGESLFRRKVDIYQELASFIRKDSIEDIDISLIESGFRRRTIDDLRNVLQPVVSDAEVIRVARHELKQRSPDAIKRLAQNVLKASRIYDSSPVEDCSLEQAMSALVDKLDGHLGYLQKAVDDLRLMNTHPEKKVHHMGEIIEKVLRSFEQIEACQSRRVELIYNTGVVNDVVLIDEGHLVLVLRNIVSNCLRSTELRRWSPEMHNSHLDFIERVSISLDMGVENHFSIRIEDNGQGIPEHILNKLYRERVTDREGRDHGMGGMIISKLLKLNGGSIQVVKTKTEEPECGTIQEIKIESYNRDAS